MKSEFIKRINFLKLSLQDKNVIYKRGNKLFEYILDFKSRIKEKLYP